jgi:hypothetical protein
MKGIRKSKRSSTPHTERKIVRIWLPPSPPPDMNDPRRSERLVGRVAQTTEPIQPDKKRLTSGSYWGADELELLRVKFEPLEEVDCLSVLMDTDWSPAEQQSIW